MTSRERLIAAARGGMADRQAWFAWGPGDVLAFARRWQPDAVIVSQAAAGDCVAELGESGPAVLVPVDGLYPRVKVAMEDWSQRPEDADLALRGAMDSVAAELDAAFSAGADGVFYVLAGAAPEHCTPMQFGGLFLEREREILSAVTDARFNVLRIEGGEGVYLDFVSDLPAHAISWDEAASGISPSEVRSMFAGAIACCLTGNPRQVWDAMQGAGFVFAGPVDDLDSADISDFKNALAELPKPVTHD